MRRGRLAGGDARRGRRGARAVLLRAGVPVRVQLDGLPRASAGTRSTSRPSHRCPYPRAGHGLTSRLAAAAIVRAGCGTGVVERPETGAGGLRPATTGWRRTKRSDAGPDLPCRPRPRAGHDLIDPGGVGRGSAAVGVHAAASPVVVTVDVESSEVREGRGGVKLLTDTDLADIRRPSRRRCSTPCATPSSASAPPRSRGPRQDLSVDGQLTIRYVMHPITVRGSLEESSDEPHPASDGPGGGKRAGHEAASALLGALR